MNPKQLIKYAFLNAVGTFTYIALIAYLLFNGEQWFGKVENTFLAPVLMLTLLVISATTTGSLVLGRPLYMIFKGKSREGVALLITTVIFLGLFIGLLLVTLQFTSSTSL